MAKHRARRKARRIDKRKTTKRQSGFASLLILVAVIFMCGVSVKVVAGQRHKSAELRETEKKLERKIDEANQEKEELTALEQYMKTNKYIEDVAKNKLGLVYPDEIVIKPAD